MLVFPTAYKILDRRIDLIRLIRACQEQGAQLAVVSDDSDVQAHAREIGVPIFTSSTVAQKLPWHRPKFMRRFFERPGGKPGLPDLQANARKNGHGIIFAENRTFQVTAFIIGVIAVVALAWLFIPSAVVILPVVRHDQDMDIQVFASPNYAAVNPNGKIPATINSIIVERSAQSASTGKVVVPDKAASGVARFTNLNPMAVNVPRGTILIAYSVQVVRFEVTDDLTVPAGSGQVALAGIQAVKAGSSGNVDAGQIRAIEGSLGLQLTVTNPDPTQGGSDRTVSSPTQADYTQLRQGLLKTLDQAALQDFQSRLQSGAAIIPPTLKLDSILNEKRDSEPGTPADTARLTIRAEYIAWSFLKNDLDHLARAVLDTKLDPGTKGLADTLLVTNQGDTVLKSGEAQWQIHVHRQAIRIWDSQEISNAITGQTRQAASQILVHNYGLDQAPRIQISPDWWPFLPAMSFRIEVRSE